MKKIIFATCILAVTSTPVFAIEFWHSGTVWANQGMCAATFSFDAGPMSDTIQQLNIAVAIRGKAGKSIGKDVLEIEEFGGSEAARYATAPLVSAEMCGDADGLVISVSKASAIIDGKKVDLLKTRQLTAREFKPFQIKVGK